MAYETGSLAGDLARAKALTTQQYGGTPNNSNVISSASLAPRPTIRPVTPTPDTTNYNGITSGVTQSIIDSYKTYNDAQIAGQANQQSTGQSILDYMKRLQDKTADTKSAYDSTGVTAEQGNITKYGQQLADLNAQAMSLNREAQAIPIQTQERNRNTGATDAGVAPQNAGDLRMNALKALSIGQQSDIASAALTGSAMRLEAAKDKAQQIIDLKYKPIEDEIALKTKQYELNKDVLASIDAKRTEALGEALKKEAQDLVEKKAAQKENAALALTAGVTTKYMNKNGELSQASDGLAFSSPIDFLKAAGIPISTTASKEEIQAGFKQAYERGLITDVNGTKLADINFANQAALKYIDVNITPNMSRAEVSEAVQRSKIYQKESYIPGNFELTDDGRIFDQNTGRIIGGVTGSDAPQDATAVTIRDSFNAVSARLTKDVRASATKILNQYLERGDIEGARQYIISTAISSLPTEQQNKAFGRQQGIDALTDIQSALDEYSQAGGDTGILKGSYEQIIQKLGQTTDPRLADINIRVVTAMIAYRNAVSGAAFTESEAKQYENIFPSIKGNTELNRTKIDSLKHVFNLNQKSTLSTIMGGRNYDDLMSADSTAGQIVEYEGRAYTVDSRGNLTPIGSGSPLGLNNAKSSGGLTLNYSPNQVKGWSGAVNKLPLLNPDGSEKPSDVVNKLTTINNGVKGGQCGRFVNQLTGLGLGDSYKSKMSKMDSKIKTPRPGMVFVMPYRDTGHTGFILSVKNGIATVKDSNYSLDGKIKTHQIPVSKMTGFAYA